MFDPMTASLLGFVLGKATERVIVPAREHYFKGLFKKVRSWATRDYFGWRRWERVVATSVRERPRERRRTVRW